jgi:hypothetical protein
MAIPLAAKVRRISSPACRVQKYAVCSSVVVSPIPPPASRQRTADQAGQLGSRRVAHGRVVLLRQAEGDALMTSGQSLRPRTGVSADVVIVLVACQFASDHRVGRRMSEPSHPFGADRRVGFGNGRVGPRPHPQPASPTSVDHPNHAAESDTPTVRRRGSTAIPRPRTRRPGRARRLWTRDRASAISPTWSRSGRVSRSGVASGCALRDIPVWAELGRSPTTCASRRPV